jgi:threonine dehydratase
VPVGGGGLLAGVAAAVKQVRSSVRVIGIEPSGAAAMKASLEAGHAVTLAKTESIADGLMPVRPGDLTLAHAQKFVDRVITVEDEQIIDAVLWLFTNAKVVAEPSGAATVAAALAGTIAGAGPLVAIVSGGNIGLDKLEELRQSRLETVDGGGRS